MNLNKYTYYIDGIRLTLLKAVLVFSVFSFSAINLQVHSAVSDSVRTELVVSRKRKPDYRLKANNKTSRKLFCISPLLELIVSKVIGLLKQCNVVKTQYKSYRDRILLYCTTARNKQIKIPRSSYQDEKLALSVS